MHQSFSAKALPETSTQACIALSFCFSRENDGFIEENETLISEVLFVIHRYAMKLRGFREDVRETTKIVGHILKRSQTEQEH